MLLLIWARYFTIQIPSTTRYLIYKEKRLLYFFAPKGLAAGLLAISSSQYSNIIPETKLIINLVFSIIILSILVSTVALFIYKHNDSKELKKENLVKHK